MGASHNSAQQYGTVSVDLPSIGATTKAAFDVTISGLAVGDVLNFHPPATMNDDLLFVGCRVKAAGIATIFVYNPTAGAIDEPALSWEYEWWDRT